MTSNTYIHDRSLYWLDLTQALKKSGGFKLVVWALSSSLSEMMRSYTTVLVVWAISSFLSEMMRSYTTVLVVWALSSSLSEMMRHNSKVNLNNNWIIIFDCYYHKFRAAGNKMKSQKDHTVGRI